MRYKALLSFVGDISMTKGEIRELADSPNVESLINANYIEAVAERKAPGRKRTAKK